LKCDFEKSNRNLGKQQTKFGSFHKITGKSNVTAPNCTNSHGPDGKVYGQLRDSVALCTQLITTDEFSEGRTHGPRAKESLFPKPSKTLDKAYNGASTHKENSILDYTEDQSGHEELITFRQKNLVGI
jgi:hypothetical protein